MAQGARLMGHGVRCAVAVLCILTMACGEASPPTRTSELPSDPVAFCERYEEVKNLARTVMLAELAAVAPPEIADPLQRASELVGSVDDDHRIDRYLDEHCG